MPNSVTSDKNLNRLYIVLDRLPMAQTEALANEILQAAAGLNPNFGVITDITNFRPGSIEVADVVKKVQSQLLSMGMGKTVRVVGERVTGKMMMNRTSQEVGYSAEEVNTLAEAEALLSKTKIPPKE